MVANLVTLSQQSPFLHRFTAPSHKPISLAPQTPIPHKPLHISGFRTSTSCHSSSYPLNSGLSAQSKVLGRSDIGFGQLGLGCFRFSAVPDGGSGGFGSGDGNSGGGGGGGGEGGGPEKDGDGWSFLAWYLALLEKYPVLTKAVTSAILGLLADVLCQLVVNKVASLNLRRTFAYSFLGLVLVGPTLHFWYLYLSKLVTLSGTSGVMLRLVIDQFVFSPIFLGVFLSALAILEGRPHEVVPTLQQAWLPVVIENWSLWIPFQFLNFRFVPQQFQVLAANVVSLAWNVMLSLKAHKAILPKKAS